MRINITSSDGKYPKYALEDVTEGEYMHILRALHQSMEKGPQDIFEIMNRMRLLK